MSLPSGEGLGSSVGVLAEVRHDAQLDLRCSRPRAAPTRRARPARARRRRLRVACARVRCGQGCSAGSGRWTRGARSRPTDLAERAVDAPGVRVHVSAAARRRRSLFNLLDFAVLEDLLDDRARRGTWPRTASAWSVAQPVFVLLRALDAGGVLDAQLLEQDLARAPWCELTLKFSPAISWMAPSDERLDRPSRASCRQRLDVFGTSRRMPRSLHRGQHGD